MRGARTEQRWPYLDAMPTRTLRQAHYPGWTVEALKYLYEDRQIIGSGACVPLDTDAAVARRTKQEVPLSLTFLARIIPY